MALFSLGDIQFDTTADGIPLDAFRQAWEWRHLFSDSVAGKGSRQFTGEGAETMSLSGVTFPKQFGAEDAVKQIRDVASTGEPQLLTDGTGAIYGEFVILSLSTERVVMNADGTGRHVTYAIELRDDWK